MSTRAALLGLVAGLLAAFIYFLPKTPPPAAAPAPLLEALAPSVADAGAAPVMPVTEPEAQGPLEPVNFAEGFCPEGGGDTIRPLFTLEKLLSTELYKRADAGGTDDAEADAMVDALKRDGNPARAVESATQLAAQSPDSIWPHLILAVAHGRLGQRDERVAELRRLRQLLPNDPATGIALADVLRDDDALDEAIDGLSVYLRSDGSPAVSRLRARLEVQRDIQRDYQRQTRDGITLLWPRDSLTNAQADEVTVAIDRGLDDAAAFTSTTRRKRLTAVIYPSRSELLAVSCVRSWTAALFDGVLRTVLATAPSGVDLKVLRHETLHAQLSPLAPAAPKWFHEGVAQAFAAERVPVHAWSQMVSNKVWIPFSSLEGSFQVFSNSDADLAYAQSYAMVELMREHGGDHAISVALTALAGGADTATALAKACGQSEVTGAELLQSIEKKLPRK